MAELLYGNLTFLGRFAGVLRQEPDGRFAFHYDEAYLSTGRPAISYTLPLQTDPLYSASGLHPFFDNLVAEGWLANAQSRALGIDVDNRFSRLLAFGHDCVGAASILDPRPRLQPNLDAGSPEETAALANRASISGVQPKLLVVKTDLGYRPAGPSEASTHIAKLPSGSLPGIVELEYLTMTAAAELLRPDEIAEIEVAEVAGLPGRCLIVRRFDRLEDGGKLHFEEFNQLLDQSSEAKYDGAYSDMAAFIRDNPRCQVADADLLLRRVLACILLGNNDAHMKKFGLLYIGSAMRLSPVYDFLAVSLYLDYDSALALRMGPGTNPSRLSAISGKNVEVLAKSFGYGRGALLQAVHDLGARLDAAVNAVQEAAHGTPVQKANLTEYMRKRWNGTFDSIRTSIRGSIGSSTGKK
jgi:serine/threonine-protein kinase HipA